MLAIEASTYRTQQRKETNIRVPIRVFFFFTLFVLLCSDCPRFCLLSLLHNTHNRNIQAPDRIFFRTRNPNKRSVADSRPRLLGHWNRPSNPRFQQRSDRRPTPWTTWPLESARFYVTLWNVASRPLTVTV